jgi:maltose alpha-D-glucosyltransferase/alpha-amylase
MERCTPLEAGWNQLFLQGVAWAEASCDSFWNAYRARAATGPLLPSPRATLVLRDAFALQKAVYEVGYELGHRPDWVSIPLRHLLAETP